MPKTPPPPPAEESGDPGAGPLGIAANSRKEVADDLQNEPKQGKLQVFRIIKGAGPKGRNRARGQKSQQLTENGRLKSTPKLVDNANTRLLGISCRHRICVGIKISHRYVVAH